MAIKKDEMQEAMNDIDHGKRKYGISLPKLPFPDMDEPKPVPFTEIKVVRTLNDNLYTLEVYNPPTQQATDVLMEVLPGVLELWLQRNRDYGDDPEGRLGPKAQFVDMYRKMKKLKRALWEGKNLTGEQPDEIIKDLIGHSMLALLDIKHGEI